MKNNSLVVVSILLAAVFGLGASCNESVWLVGFGSYTDTGSLATDFAKPIRQSVTEFEQAHKLSVDKLIIELPKTRVTVDSDLFDPKPENLRLEFVQVGTEETEEHEIWSSQKQTETTDVRQLSFSYLVGGSDYEECNMDTESSNSELADCPAFSDRKFAEAYAVQLATKLKEKLEAQTKLYYVLKDTGDRITANIALNVVQMDCTVETLPSLERVSPQGDQYQYMDYVFQDRVVCQGLAVLTIN